MQPEQRENLAPSVEQLGAQLDIELAELAQLLPPEHYARVEQFAFRVVQTVYAGLDAAEAPASPFGAPSVPCRRCGAVLPPEMGAAALALRGDRPLTFPNGRPRPDLTGLAVWIAGAFEHPQPDESDADIFVEAFTVWTGAPPLAFVAAMRHIGTDVGLLPA